MTQFQFCNGSSCPSSSADYKQLLSKNKVMQNGLKAISRQIDGFELMSEHRPQDSGTTFLIQNIREIIQNTERVNKRHQMQMISNQGSRSGQSHHVPKLSSTTTLTASNSTLNKAVQKTHNLAHQKLNFIERCIAEFIVTAIILIFFYSFVIY